MKKILVIGAYGQIGSELTQKLRKQYGSENVIASDIKLIPESELSASGPFEQLDVLNGAKLVSIVKKHKIDCIYNLAALLSAVAEEKPHAAWNIGINGLYNVLEVARENQCAVFFPSSIGAFGSNTPLDDTPQDTIMRPSTMYGITKVTGELLCDYYYKRFGVDTRGVRYPGIISNETLPGGGTTDYAVEIYYEAVKYGKFICPLKEGTYLDMMYMPDALDAAIHLMQANPDRLKHRNAFNITSMSFAPKIIASEIKKHIPDFEILYRPDTVKQSIADTWPNNMNDSCAREEWAWNPTWNLENMTKDMLEVITKKHEGLI